MSEVDEPPAQSGSQERARARVTRGKSSTYVVFSVNAVRLAVPAPMVEMITEELPVTPVPLSPPHIHGMVRFGERVFAAVDVAGMLDVPAPAGAAPAEALYRRTLLVSTAGLEAGIACDRVQGLLTATQEEIGELSVLKGGAVSGHVIGEVERAGEVIGIVDLEALLRAAVVR